MVITAPIGLLFLSYPDPDGPPIEEDEELDAIRTCLAAASHGAEVRIHTRANLPVEELPQLLMTLRPAIIHVLTHGDARGRLRLTTRDGLRDVEMDNVAGLLGSTEPPPALIVFSACYSAPLAAKLEERGSVVTGWTHRIPVATARCFSSTLYQRIANGGTLTAAIASALAAATAADSEHYPRMKVAGSPESGDRRLIDVGAGDPGVSPPVEQGSRAHQVLILVNAYHKTSLTEEAFLDQVEPARYTRTVVRLSDHMDALGMDRITQIGADFDGIDLAHATEALANAALAAMPDDGRPTDLYLVGNAPHAVFVHLGYKLSAWSGGRQILLHRNVKEDGRWVRIVIPGDGTAGANYFQETRGLQAGAVREGGGTVGLFLSARPGAIPGSLNDTLRARPGGLAGTVGLFHTRIDPATGEPTLLDDRTGANAARELVTVCARIATQWPHHSGLAVAVFGPDILGFLVGRAINPQVHPAVHLLGSQRGADAYRVLWSLPVVPRAAPTIPTGPADELRRTHVFQTLAHGLKELADTLDAEDCAAPAGFGPRDPRWVRDLRRAARELVPRMMLHGSGFELSRPRRTISIGHDLLHALVGLDTPTLHRFARLLFLHELVHFCQNLTSLNYHDVGRAGVVLEDVDFWADAFALHTCVRWETRRSGIRGEEEVGAILCVYLETHLRGLCAFDRMEQGAALEAFPERRLRRYLLWALQWARAETVHTPEAVDALFALRPFIELAPLKGRMSPVSDKLVARPTEHTQLYIGLGARLIRESRDAANFSPGALVEHARTLDVESLKRALRFVVEKHLAILAPWAD